MKKVNAIETGQRIRLLMLNRGVSSDELARKLNYSSRVTVNRWVRGDAVPSYENLVNISEVLRCRPDELVVMFEED